MKLDEIIAAILSGVALSIYLPSLKEEIAPVAQAAFSWQEKTVQVAEKMGSCSASASRAELESNRSVLNERLSAFNSILPE